MGVGFSYGHLKVTNQSMVSDSFYRFLTGFYNLHPEYRKRDLIMAGESYAGRYIPNMAIKIREENNKLDATDQINIKALLISNGFVTPYQRLSVRSVPVAMGAVTDDLLP